MAKNAPNPENAIKLSKGIYLVRTQAGFRKVLRDLFASAGWPWHDRKSRGFAYPKKYPQVLLLMWDHESARPVVIKLRKAILACEPYLTELHRAEDVPSPSTKEPSP